MKRILVPLDGSPLAERVLVVAGDLAEAISGTLVIARVVPPQPAGRAYRPGLSEDLAEAETKEAEAYLDSVAERLRGDRLYVESVLLHGEVAPSIIKAIEEQRCDLVAISSHGMSGLASQVFGSVAQKLLYASPCPVLVVRSTEQDLEGEEEREEAAADAALLGELAKKQG